MPTANWLVPAIFILLSLHICFAAIGRVLLSSLFSMAVELSAKLAARSRNGSSDLEVFLGKQKSSRNRGCQKCAQTDSNQRERVPWDLPSNALITRLPTGAAESTENLWYLCNDLINVYCS